MTVIDINSERKKRSGGGGKGGGGSSGGGRGEAVPGWKNELRKGRGGKEYLGDAKNVRIALTYAPSLVGLVQLNQLAQRIEITRDPPWRKLADGVQWNEDDDIELACYLQDQAIPVRSDSALTRIVHAHAAQNPVHPVRDWLASLAWDGQPRIAEVLREVLCAQVSREDGGDIYLDAVLRRFMIAAVARVMRPGCKADHMLVLVGSQGCGKSSFAAELAAPWGVESHSMFGSKDAVLELAGAWVVEIAELSGMKRSDIETVKNFISKVSDHYRPPYGRHIVDQPRTCVFVGTTNDDRFLIDHTGNRRFWPVQCVGRIDLALLRSQREQLWAEARSAFDAGEQWHLTAEEAGIARDVQEGCRQVGEVEQETMRYLTRRLSGEWKAPLDVSVYEVFREINGVDGDAENLIARRQLETQIGQAIRRTGEWKAVGRRGEYRSTTYRYIGPLLQRESNLSN